MVGWNNILGVHADALQLRAKRAEILANNIANADTPNFKARDVDFKKALAASQSAPKDVMLSTQARHQGPQSTPLSLDLTYRIPTQDSADGNTVDKEIEVAQFSQNAIEYSASLNFLNGRIRSIMSALRGE